MDRHGAYQVLRCTGTEPLDAFVTLAVADALTVAYTDNETKVTCHDGEFDVSTLSDELCDI